MAGRFPFDSQGRGSNNPLHNAQVRAALGLSNMDEALYLQRQQELQRDFQLRQMLLQEQIDHQSRIDSMLHEHQLKAVEHLHDFPDLQSYSRFLLNEQLQRQELLQRQDERTLLARERVQLQQQEELRRRQALAAAAAAQQSQSQHLSASQQQHEYARVAAAAAAAAKVPSVTHSSSAAVAAAASKPASSAPAPRPTSVALLRDLAADSLSGNAVRRSELDKRVFAKGEEADETTTPPPQGPAKKRPRSGTHESIELEKDQKLKAVKKTKPSPKKPKNKTIAAPPQVPMPAPTHKESTPMLGPGPTKPSAEALLEFAEISNSKKKESPGLASPPVPNPLAKKPPPPNPLENKKPPSGPPRMTPPFAQPVMAPPAPAPKRTPQQPSVAPPPMAPPPAALPTMAHPPPPARIRTPTPIITLGTIGDLVKAAKDEQKSDDAADVLVGIKKHVDWPDSEAEEEVKKQQEKEEEEAAAAKREIEIALEKGDTIQLPGFTSILPQLPEEPGLEDSGEKEKDKKRRKKKFKGILDEDSVDSKRSGERKASTKPPVSEIPVARKELAVIEYPYPIDTWWPSVSSIRRERKSVGEPQDEDAFPDDPEVSGENSEFRMNMDKVKDSLSSSVTPGVLEKIPHCKIHRMHMKKKKNPLAPELVFCFQVTELYPNDVMVCCSHCGTWRHTACGGHHKPFSIRECIDTPFNAVCDRCHEEEKVLVDNPVARRRIDRQRTEQIRRSMSTSATMRQASFSKHGGTYKWPLGSVSATHIGGHTRSVHSRHDKAERQWSDMATRLSRIGYRPKERVKVRTKELERLLVSVEDAEGHTDRHNMMVFLMQDTLREKPVGFEAKRRNIFDPEEDEVPNDVCQTSSKTEGSEAEENPNSAPGDPLPGEDDGDNHGGESGGHHKKELTACSRAGCSKRPRFDSVFCSDSCGVSALESDLLRTFEYSSDIHPSLLRN